MIIKTRYRDVPWEEILPYHGGVGVNRWDELRGMEISIECIAQPPKDVGICKGPVFKIVEGPVVPAVACSHLAEIGD